MITEETVFILGAGASAPYGYPTGAGLKRLICYETIKLLDQLIPNASAIDYSWQKDQTDAIIKHSGKFIDQFRESPGDFIDRFLEANSKVPFIPETGRTLITLSILLAEKDSKFLGDMSEKNMARDWYKELFNLMDEQSRGSEGYLEFRKNKVNFITFNYDRSLEYFFYNSLLRTYGSIDLKKHKPLDLIPFKFVHVYGKIDNFPWEEPSGLEYRAEYRVRDIIRKVGSNIKLIHEKDDAFLNEIKELIADAKNIFSLGFGYDEDNMKALGWPEGFNEGKNIFGTAFKLSADRITEIRAMIQEGFKKPDLSRSNPVIKPLDCRSLLDECKNYLSG